jgi:hypothetical protein
MAALISSTLSTSVEVQISTLHPERVRMSNHRVPGNSLVTMTRLLPEGLCTLQSFWPIDEPPFSFGNFYSNIKNPVHWFRSVRLRRIPLSNAMGSGNNGLFDGKHQPFSGEIKTCSLGQNDMFGLTAT